MKRYFIKVTIIFFAFTLSLSAHEKKKIHLKMIKSVDGETIVTDTLIDTKDHKGIYFYESNADNRKVDSLIKKMDMFYEDGVEIISISDEIDVKDDNALVWLSLTTDSDEDSIRLEKHMHIISEGDEEIVKSKTGMAWIVSDSSDYFDDIHLTDIIHNHFISKGEKFKIELLSCDQENSFMWTIDSLCDKDNPEYQGVFVYSTGENTFNVIRSGEGKNSYEKVIMKKAMGEESMNVYVTDDGNHTIIKIEELDKNDSDSEKKIKVYKQKTDDEKVEFKVEILDEGEKEGKTHKMKIIQTKEKGVFKVEFNLDDKVPTLIIVENNDGKTVYSKKIKKFNGTYTGDINLSKEPDGKYLMQIIQADKTLIKSKIQK